MQSKPEGPPNRWCKSQCDPYPFDIVTGDVYIDREIARKNEEIPRPLWWRLRNWWRYSGRSK